MACWVIVETATLSEAELGEYCRRKGLYPVSVRRTRIVNKTLLPHASLIQYNESEVKYGKTVFSQ